MTNKNAQQKLQISIFEYIEACSDSQPFQIIEKKNDTPVDFSEYKREKSRDRLIDQFKQTGLI